MGDEVVVSGIAAVVTTAFGLSGQDWGLREWWRYWTPRENLIVTGLIAVAHFAAGATLAQAAVALLNDGDELNVLEVLALGIGYGLAAEGVLHIDIGAFAGVLKTPLTASRLLLQSLYDWLDARSNRRARVAIYAMQDTDLAEYARALTAEVHPYDLTEVRDPREGGAHLVHTNVSVNCRIMLGQPVASEYRLANLSIPDSDQDRDAARTILRKQAVDLSIQTRLLPQVSAVDIREGRVAPVPGRKATAVRRRGGTTG